MMRQEIAFKDHNNALEVAKRLLDESYVVMLSREEDLLILNYEYAENANRNEIVFMSRDVYEEEIFARNQEDEYEDYE